MRSYCIKLSFVLLFFSCKKDKGDLPVFGTLHDKSGLAGCGWAIDLDKKDKDGCGTVEATNLSDFDLILKDGQRVEFLYTETQGASICMVGKVVVIRSIRAL